MIEQQFDNERSGNRIGPWLATDIKPDEVEPIGIEAIQLRPGQMMLQSNTVFLLVNELDGYSHWVPVRVKEEFIE